MYVTFVVFAAFVFIINATIDIATQTYIINTSLPANEYLKDICFEQKSSALFAIPSMLDTIPTAVRNITNKIAMDYWKSGAVIEPFHSEIEYLSKCTGISIQELITANIVYDLTAICTSIIVAKKDGTILHARNQDFPIALRKLTMHIQLHALQYLCLFVCTFVFISDTFNMIYVDINNKTLYEATTFFGYVGIPTGIKYGSFSITMNGRYDIFGLKNWIEIKKGYFPAGWLTRQAFLYDSNFSSAVQRLSTSVIQAPVYFIIAGLSGTMDAAIITRNQSEVNGPNGGHLPLYLKDSPYTWYLLETNYDYWKVAKDMRRESAVRMLDEVGQENITFEKLFEILGTPPVLQWDTVYTTLMSPSNRSYYNSTIRFDTS